MMAESLLHFVDCQNQTGTAGQKLKRCNLASCLRHQSWLAPYFRRPPLTPALPPLVRLSHAQAPAVLDHSSALAQGDGGARPAFAGGAEGGEGELVVLDAGDVLHHAFAVRCPGIDAEGEVRSGFHAIALTSSLP